MNRQRLKQRIMQEVVLLRAISDRLADSANYLERTANTISSVSVSTSSSNVYGESGNVGSHKIAEVAARLERISYDLTPNMDYLTNSSGNPRDYD